MTAEGDALVKNASSPKQVKSAKQKQRERDQRDERNIRELLGTRGGRAWFYRKMVWCRIFASTFVLGDPYGSALNEGQRLVGLSLLADVNRLEPAVYTLMRNEYEEDKVRGF